MLKTHPGPVVHLSDNPLDANKLLIGYESGLIVLWDMRGKYAELRWQSHEPLKSISWHYEGKHFVTSHIDGSLCTWPLRTTPKPQLHVFPHAKPTKDGKLETCKPIHKVELKTSRTGWVTVLLNKFWSYLWEPSLNSLFFTFEQGVLNNILWWFVDGERWQVSVHYCATG